MSSIIAIVIAVLNCKIDNTSKRENETNEYFEQLMIKEEIPEEVYKRANPFGSQRPRLYGLPKTHKTGVPLRPILSMVSSPQHRLAKYLNNLLKPVLDLYSRYTIKDSFEFVKIAQGTPASNTYMGIV